MPTISVIVPVYNTEKYLRRCVDSILAQTFTDFELLLIDDGSTDSSPAICDEYAKSDSRVRVFHKENGGVSSARNLALDNVNGEWITFADSDDWVEVNFIEDLFLNCNNADLVVNDFIIEGKQKPGWERCIEYGMVTTESFLTNNSYDFSQANICTICCKLFKKDIISKFSLAFNTKISFAEDNLFVIQYIYHTSKIRFTNSPLYHYRVEGTSLSSKFDIKGFMPLLKDTLEIGNKFIMKYHISPVQFHTNNIPGGLCNDYVRFITHNKTWNERLTIITKLLQYHNFLVHIQNADSHKYGHKTFITKLIFRTRNVYIINLMMAIFKTIRRNPI